MGAAPIIASKIGQSACRLVAEQRDELASVKHPDHMLAGGSAMRSP